MALSLVGAASGLYFLWKETRMKSAAERLVENGYENVVVFAGEYTYDDALIAVTDDERAVYDFDKMVSWLAKHEGVDELTATEWLDHEMLLGLQEMGPDGPVVIYPLQD